MPFQWKLLSHSASLFSISNAAWWFADNFDSQWENLSLQNLLLKNQEPVCSLIHFLVAVEKSGMHLYVGFVILANKNLGDKNKMTWLRSIPCFLGESVLFFMDCFYHHPQLLLLSLSLSHTTLRTNTLTACIFTKMLHTYVELPVYLSSKKTYHILNKTLRFLCFFRSSQN